MGKGVRAFSLFSLGRGWAGVHSPSFFLYFLFLFSPGGGDLYGKRCASLSFFFFFFFPSGPTPTSTASFFSLSSSWTFHHHFSFSLSFSGRTLSQHKTPPFFFPFLLFFTDPHPPPNWVFSSLFSEIGSGAKFFSSCCRRHVGDFFISFLAAYFPLLGRPKEQAQRPPPSFFSSFSSLPLVGQG